MLQILSLDRKYISYTLALKRYLLKFLFAGKRFPVEIGAANFLVQPRSSDLFTLYEIYIDQGYYPKLKSASFDIQNVVDLGANIGVFSVWIAHMAHPKTVLAVEMEPGCYQRLVGNIALNHLEGIVRPLHAAVFSQSGSVGMRKIPGCEFYEVVPKRATHHVRALSFDELLASSGMERIDLLKIDIEGAEKYVLTAENARLFQDRVRYILLETHSLNDFHTEHAVTYLSGLGFRLAMTPTPYVIDRNYIIDAWNPALDGSDNLRRLDAPFASQTILASE